VIGLGYVGLSLAVCFANKCFRVIGYDVDEKKVRRINSGEPPFYEPGLEDLLQRSLKKGFKAFTKIIPSRVNFITVGTPHGDKGVDLSQVESASRELGFSLSNRGGYSLVVVKSTVPPGTTEGLVREAIELASGKECGREIGLAMNPEFLREGSAIEDTLRPDRIVIGQYDNRSGDTLLSLYRRFYGKNIPALLRTSIVNAELIKYANNAFLATKVSFINMIANLCHKIPGADVDVIAEGIGMDRRIGREFLRAGPGWSGSCLPKDTRALKSIFLKEGVESPVLDGVMQMNEIQPLKVLDAVKESLGDLRGKRVAVLGLSFKPNTDDVRDSISIRVIELLLERGAVVSAYDPVAVENAKRTLEIIDGATDGVYFAKSLSDALDEADCCVVLTEWDEFRKLRQENFSGMKNKLIVDTRRILKQSAFKHVKLISVGIGQTHEKAKTQD
jgi:UDPglucose 6-dehydrogenase